MAEIVGLVASVIALTKIINLCGDYFDRVKDAQDDIAHLKQEAESLENAFNTLQGLRDDTNGQRISGSQELKDVVGQCGSLLDGLVKQLEAGKSGSKNKFKKLLASGTLKWPLTKAQTSDTIARIERYKQTILLNLQIYDIARSQDNIREKNLSMLPFVSEAAFRDDNEDGNECCLEGTRTDLLRDIIEWANDAQGKSIFWLKGMAGTGKSTISRTVARMLTNDGRLGGSFFFKRGEGNRGNAKLFFTTIAAQLAHYVPEVADDISKAIGEGTTSGATKLKLMTLREQFKDLIHTPLCSLNRDMDIIVVVDAMDECDNQAHVETILRLFSQTAPPRLRLFATSRPELLMRLNFEKLPDGTHQDLVLHDIPPHTVEQDISLFLRHELERIKKHRNLRVQPHRQLSPDWPADEDLRILVEMAVPLFICAKTVCRFVGDPGDDPRIRLSTVLKYRRASEASENFDPTYLPILDSLVARLGRTEKARRLKDFQQVVGSIVNLADPLSVVALSNLIGISRECVECMLDSLHSVLSIPENEDLPVRLFHLSFRDFLVDPERREDAAFPFWIDANAAHSTLASRCLERLFKPNTLKQDICSLESPGKLRIDIDDKVVQSFLPPDAQYACRYWVFHLAQSETRIHDNEAVHHFLETHFLHWLEALSLVGNITEAIHLVTCLQSLVSPNESTRISAFLYDAKRFVLKNQYIIGLAPLQLYSSALPFAPEMSIIRKSFENEIPSWVTGLPEVERTWSADLQTLYGHTDVINIVKFSPDGKLLASGSYDFTIRLWDSSTGAPAQVLAGHTDWVQNVLFSPDGKLLASTLYDSTVRLWDPATGALLHIFETPEESVFGMAFSPAGKLLASSDKAIRLWDSSTGASVQVLAGHTDWIRDVLFSPDGRLLASASDDTTVRLWDPAKEVLLHVLEGHTGMVWGVLFSPNGKLLASTSKDKTVRLWDPTEGALLHVFGTEGHPEFGLGLFFSPDGNLLASSSNEPIVRLWDPVTGALLQTLEVDTVLLEAVAFTPDGTLLVSTSGNPHGTIKLWEPTTGEWLETFEGHAESVRAVAFTPDGKLLASASYDATVKLWDPNLKSPVQLYDGHTAEVKTVKFSADGKLLASTADDYTVKLWDPVTGKLIRVLGVHPTSAIAVAFTPDGKRLASSLQNSTIMLWDSSTGALLQTFKGCGSELTGLIFSPDGKVLSSSNLNDKTVRLWDTATGASLGVLKADAPTGRAAMFSSDGKLLALASWEECIIGIWDPATCVLLQVLEVEGYTDPSYAVAFSSDDKLLASVSPGRAPRVWELATGQFEEVQGINVAKLFQLPRTSWFNGGHLCLPHDMFIPMVVLPFYLFNMVVNMYSQLAGSKAICVVK